MDGKKIRKGITSACLTAMFFLLLIRLPVKAEAAEKSAEEESDLDMSLMEEVDFGEIDDILKEQEATSSFDFKGLVKKLIGGEEIDKTWLLKMAGDAVFSEVIQSRSYIIQILLLVTVFALLYNFANVFQNTAVSDISFYIVYMILLVLLIKSFLLMNGILTETLTVLMDFMRALLPAFCLTMVFSAGSASAMGIYQVTLFIIYIIEAVLIYGVVPAVQIYVMLELLNHLTKEEMISKLAELIKTGVEWVLKFLFTMVIGINVVQGLLTPVIDGFKTTMFAKTAEIIPGLGTSVSAVTEIMVGSGIIIKNGVGVAGILLVLILLAGPTIKIGIMAILYKLLAAVIQPIADKRISGCISGMGEGARLLVKIMITASVMFLVTIALVTAATTWNR